MRYESLKKNSDFKRVYNKGKSYADKFLVIYFIPNNLENTRLGISVSKKVGNSVVRHHITRLIKENFRLNYNDKKNYDIIFVARIRSKDADFHKIERSMNFLLKKLG